MRILVIVIAIAVLLVTPMSARGQPPDTRPCSLEFIEQRLAIVGNWLMPADYGQSTVDMAKTTIRDEIEDLLETCLPVIESEPVPVLTNEPPTLDDSELPEALTAYRTGNVRSQPTTNSSIIDFLRLADPCVLYQIIDESPDEQWLRVTPWVEGWVFSEAFDWESLDQIPLTAQIRTFRKEGQTWANSGNLGVGTTIDVKGVDFATGKAEIPTDFLSTAWIDLTDLQPLLINQRIKPRASGEGDNLKYINVRREPRVPNEYIDRISAIPLSEDIMILDIQYDQGPPGTLQEGKWWFKVRVPERIVGYVPVNGVVGSTPESLEVGKEITVRPGTPVYKYKESLASYPDFDLTYGVTYLGSAAGKDGMRHEITAPKGGWVFKELLTPYPQGAQIIVSAQAPVNLRADASFEAPAIASVRPNQQVTVLDASRDGFWLNVQTENGAEGWVGACYFAVADM